MTFNWNRYFTGGWSNWKKNMAICKECGLWVCGISEKGTQTFLMDWGNKLFVKSKVKFWQQNMWLCSKFMLNLPVSTQVAQIPRQGSDYSYLVSTAKSDFSEFCTCFHTDSQVKWLRYNIRVFFAALPKMSNIKLHFLEFNVHVVFVLPTKKTVVCTSDIYDQITYEETDFPPSKVMLLLLLS